MTQAQPYIFRANAFEHETMIRLSDAGIHVMCDGGESLLGWDQIARVRLSYEPSRVQRERYYCRLYEDRAQAPLVTIASTTYRGIMNFEPQTAAYCALIRALHGRLAGRGAQITYQAGVSAASYWANAALVTVAFSALALVLMTIGQEVAWGGLVWAKFVVIAAMAPLAAGWFYANRPGRYDPGAIPAKLLPDEA